MEERTYGGLSLDELDKYPDNQTEIHLVAYIRELLAENAALKADRQAFGLAIAEETWRVSQHQSVVMGVAVPDLLDIVEQELNK